MRRNSALEMPEGSTTFSVPFAFAIGMLATGRVGDRWQVECRRWTLVAFTFFASLLPIVGKSHFGRDGLSAAK